MNNLYNIYSPNVLSCTQFVMGKEIAPSEEMKEQNFAPRDIATQI